MLKLTLVFFLMTEVTSADIKTDFGFGPASLSVAGADRAESTDAYSVINNPALMDSFGNSKSKVAGSLFLTQGFFGSIENVVVDNPYLGGSSVVKGNVDTKQNLITIAQVGIQTPLFSNNSNWMLGLAAAIPVDRLVEFENRDWYRPTYVMYGSKIQKLDLAFGLSRRLGEAFTLGLSLNTYLNFAANVRSRLPQQPTSTTTFNMSASGKLGLSPALGLIWKASEVQNFAFSYSAAKDYRIDFNFDNYIYLLANPTALTLDGGGRMYYDPAVISLSWARRAQEGTYLLAVDFEKWSPYDGSPIKINFKTVSSFMQFPESNIFRDVFVPKVGYSFFLNPTCELRFGYSYRPTPIPIQTGPTNLLDSDKHIYAFGGSTNLGKFNFFQEDTWLKGGVQIQKLVQNKIQKTDGTYIGGPEVTINGTVAAIAVGISKDF